MGIPKWLQIVQQFAPMVLAFTPLAPIAPMVAAGIQAAENMQGATSEQKLASVVAIARDGIAATNAQAGKVVLDPAMSDAVIQNIVSTAVNVTNLVHSTHVATVTP